MIPKILLILLGICSFFVSGANPTDAITDCGFLLGNPPLLQTPRSGNPILPGWYADPEAHIFENEYWIYPTYSAPYDEQVFMDAFSSKDLVVWRKHPRILDVADMRWVTFKEITPQGYVEGAFMIAE